MKEPIEIQVSRSGEFEILGENNQVQHKEFRSEEELLKALPSFIGKPVYDRKPSLGRKDLSFADNNPEGNIIGVVDEVSFTSSGEVIAQIRINNEESVKELLSQEKIIKTAYKCSVSPSDREGCLYDQVDLDADFCYLTKEGRFD